MTQRVELATIVDRLAIDALITDYAAAVDDGDWAAYRALFTSSGRADHTLAGGIEADAARSAVWLAETLAPYALRQYLIVNRRLRFGVLERDTGDTAHVRADFVNPMRADRPGETSTAPDFVSGGRYEADLLRTAEGWRLTRIAVQEKWRRTA